MSPRDQLKERKWLARLKSGDATAFIEIYDDYAARVYRHVRLRVGRREVAEDIAATVFLKAWEYISKEPGKLRSVKPFLFRVANNLIVDYYRSRDKHEPKLLEEDADILHADLEVEASVFTRLERRDTRKRVTAALQKIPPQYKEILVWRYIDEFSVPTIMQLSGKSRDAVYVTIYRALRALRGILEKLDKKKQS